MEKGISSLLAVAKRRSLPALITFSAVLGGAIAYLAVAPRLYETSARLIYDDNKASVSEIGRDLTRESASVPTGVSPLANQAELVKSQRVLERALKILASEPHNRTTTSKLTTGDLSHGLKVKIVPATNILEVSFQSKEPQLAAKVTNAVSQAMVEDNIKAINSEATKIREFLQKEVPKAQQQLLQAEAAKEKYKKQSGLVSYDEQTKSLVQSLATLDDQERTVSSQLREARAQDASLRQITQAGSIHQAYATVRSGEDEELKRLRLKLSQLDSQVIEAREKFTDQHPTVVKLVGERDAMRAMYNQELARVAPKNQSIDPKDIADDQISQDLTSKLILNETQRLALEKKLKLIQAERAKLQARLAQLPLKQQPLTALTRHTEETAASLKFLQSKLEEARIAEAQKVSNIQIIERAVAPTLPTSPRQSVVLTVAGTFGVILTISVVLLLEMMDNTLRDGAEAEELLKLPLLGVLPQLPAKTLVLEPANRFLDNVELVEPYRTFFKTLEFRSHKLRMIVISSTISGEGKSVVTSHLAAVSAMLSWRTLIIDADLRRPVQHTLFNLPPKPGLTNVIEGSKSLQEAVQPTDIDNLDILTCGELHGRPSQFLESVAMRSLLEEASDEYDLVIIDTPPISACADASTIGRQSDGVVFVTRSGYTVKEALLKAVSELTQNRIPILGVVVNGMTNAAEKYRPYPLEGDQPQNLVTGLGELAKNLPMSKRSN